MKSVFDIIRNTDDEIAFRTAGKGMVSSLNFTLLVLFQQHQRVMRFGMPVPAEGNSVDERNAQDHEVEGEQFTGEYVRPTQGFTEPEDYLKLAAQIVAIRDSVNSWLAEHATRIALISDPSKTMPDPWHVGEDFAAMIERRVNATPIVNEAKVRQEVAFLKQAGITRTEDEIRMLALRNARNQVGQLAQQKDDIIASYRALSIGKVVDLDQAEEMFEDLPPIYQLRTLARVDISLSDQAGREVTVHFNGGPRAAAALGNIALLDEARRNVLAYTAARCKEESFQRGLEGHSYPAFGPALPPKEEQKQA